MKNDNICFFSFWKNWEIENQFFHFFGNLKVASAKHVFFQKCEKSLSTRRVQPSFPTILAYSAFTTSYKIVKLMLRRLWTQHNSITKICASYNIVLGYFHLHQLKTVNCWCASCATSHLVCVYVCVYLFIPVYSKPCETEHPVAWNHETQTHIHMRI